MQPIITAITIIFWTLFGVFIFMLVASIVTNSVKQVISAHYLSKPAYEMGLRQDAKEVLKTLEKSLHNGKWIHPKEVERTS